jgi:uncharacterized lipoprotein YajG
MMTKIKTIKVFFIMLLIGFIAFSCSNSQNTEEQTPPAEEAVTPTSTPEVAVDTTVVDTSAAQRPIIRQ